MFIAAQNKYDIDMDKSWMIGDKETDLKAAKSAEISNTILLRGDHNLRESSSNARFIVDSIKDSKSIITL